MIYIGIIAIIAGAIATMMGTIMFLIGLGVIHQ